jgi:hypothetical protein
MLPKEIISKTVDFLGPYGPDALLAFVLFLAALGAVSAGADPWFVGGLALFLYVIYAVRQTLAERHKERLRAKDVETTALNLQKYQIQQRAKLERERLKSLPPSEPKRKK